MLEARYLIPGEDPSHLPTSMVLVCIGIDRLGQAEIVVADITKLGGRR